MSLFIIFISNCQEKRGSKSEFEDDPPDLEGGVAVLPAGGDGGGGQDEQEEDDGTAGHCRRHADAAQLRQVRNAGVQARLCRVLTRLGSGLSWFGSRLARYVESLLR